MRRLRPAFGDDPVARRARRRPACAAAAFRVKPQRFAMQIQCAADFAPPLARARENCQRTVKPDPFVMQIQCAADFAQRAGGRKGKAPCGGCGHPSATTPSLTALVGN